MEKNRENKNKNRYGVRGNTKPRHFSRREKNINKMNEEKEEDEKEPGEEEREQIKRKMK